MRSVRERIYEKKKLDNHLSELFNQRSASVNS